MPSSVRVSDVGMQVIVDPRRRGAIVGQVYSKLYFWDKYAGHLKSVEFVIAC